jgi:hypothetical protein
MSTTRKKIAYGAAGVAAVALLLWSSIAGKPEDSATESWKTASSTEAMWKFPDLPETGYVHPVDWPPALQIVSGLFSCTETGKEIERAGETHMVTIGNRTYCRTIETGAAAGSVYRQYAYAFEKDGRTGIFTFTVRSVQCANYDEPNASECREAQASFYPDVLIDAVVRTLEFKN